MSTRKLIPIGTQFHYWTVIAEAPARPTYHTRYFCKCKCGNVRTVMAATLRIGQSRSCGCFNEEIHAKRLRKHGHSRHGLRTRTYESWVAMHNRCRGGNTGARHNYCDRGISVCARWDKFENFLADMGERPAGKTLDRYPNNDGNYEPGNCRWATRMQQTHNRRPKEKLK